MHHIQQLCCLNTYTICILRVDNSARVFTILITGLWLSVTASGRGSKKNRVHFIALASLIRHTCHARRQCWELIRASSIEVCITRLRVAQTTWTDFVDFINGIFIVFHLLVNYLKLHNIYSAHYLQLSSLQLTDGAFIKHCVCTVHRSSFQNNPRIQMPSHHYLLYNQPNTQKS